MLFSSFRRFGFSSEGRVICPQCRTRMALKGAMPGLGLLPELRMFQCKLCDKVETRLDEASERTTAGGARKPGQRRLTVRTART